MQEEKQELPHPVQLPHHPQEQQERLEKREPYVGCCSSLCNRVHLTSDNDQRDVIATVRAVKVGFFPASPYTFSLLQKKGLNELDGPNPRRRGKKSSLRRVCTGQSDSIPLSPDLRLDSIDGLGTPREGGRGECTCKRVLTEVKSWLADRKLQSIDTLAISFARCHFCLK